MPPASAGSSPPSNAAAGWPVRSTCRRRCCGFRWGASTSTTCGRTSMPSSEPTRLAVVLFDGASLGIMSFAFGVFDLAVHYGPMPELEVRVVAGEPDARVAGGGLTCAVPYDLAAIEAADLVLVPNWRAPGTAPPAPVLAALRTAHARGARIAGLCSGAFVLAEAGLLDNRPATTHWAMAPLLARRHPTVKVQDSVLFVDDGDVLTPG